MNKTFVEKILRSIGLGAIAACAIMFFVVFIPLTGVIAYDTMLPAIIIDILLILFGIIVLIMIFSLLLSIKTLIQSKRHQSHLVLDFFMILFLLIVPFFTVSISNVYREPDSYKPLSEFDQTNWVQFNATTWEEEQNRIWNDLNFLWGDKPALVPLNPQVLEETHSQGYTRFKMRITVENSSTPQWDIMPFYLLIPDVLRSNPCPAIVVHHQHNGRFEYGKVELCGIAGDPRQAVALDLVQSGYIVACHDALCFGERQEFSEKYTGMKMFMLNRTLNFKYIWDVSRLIDYLLTLPEVNSSRIGIMGHSLGGQMAAWCAVYDSRIKIALSSCGIGKFDGNNSILAEGTFQNYAFYIPGIVKLNIRMEEILGLIGNRSLFLSAGTEDYGLPIDGVAEIHNWLERKYEFYNSRNIITVRHIGGHLLPTKTKTMMYNFLDQIL